MSRFLDITIGGAVLAALVTGVFGIYGLGEAARQRLEWDQYTRKAGNLRNGSQGNGRVLRERKKCPGEERQSP